MEVGFNLSKKINPHGISRRALLSSVFVASGFGLGRDSAVAGYSGTKPVGLAGGLEVRDHRIFPTRDVMRFLVEVHNATDELIDTPALGVIFDHLPEKQNFAFAMPSSDVLYPHTSGVLIGVAPDGLEDDDSWGSPEWFLCEDFQTTQTDELAELELALAYTVDTITNSENAHISADVTNYGRLNTNSFTFGGEVYDSANRICGVVPYLSPWWAQAGQTTTYLVDIWCNRPYVGNPFVLVESAHEMTVRLNLQPAPKYRGVKCPAVLPWNQ